MSLGNLDHADPTVIQQASRVIGPLSLYLFTLIIVLVVMNMFVAILMDFYNEACDELASYLKVRKAPGWPRSWANLSLF